MEILGTFFGETAGSAKPSNLADGKSSFSSFTENSLFGERLEELFNIYKDRSGIDIKRDLPIMVSDRTFMEEYKTDLITPIIEAFQEASPNDPHIMVHCDNVNKLWDAKVRQYSEQASTTAFLPIATLEFPVLVKQYFASITKDIIDVETVKSPNIQKHIKTTYLVDNATGDMYEYPKCIFEGTWDKIWDAAKGLPFPKDPVTDQLYPIDITAGAGWNINLVQFAVNGDGTGADAPVGVPSPGADALINFNQRLSYAIVIVAIDYDGEIYIPLPRNNQITMELSTNGTLVNGDLNFISPAGNQVEDLISGRVNFLNGTMTVSSANGKTTAIYVEGYLSNENNERTVSVRENRTFQKFLIEDGPRWNMPFTIEEIQDASALLDMNYYNRMVDEITKTMDMIESQTVLKFFDTEFRKFLGANYNIYNLESIVHESYVDLRAPVGYAGNPFEYITDALQFAVRGSIHELTDAAKLDKLSFVIRGNPMATQLLSKWITWKIQTGTAIGGIEVNNSYGMLTDMNAPVRVVASNQIQSHTANPVPPMAQYPTYVGGMRELVLHIAAFPTDPEHVSFKHLKYTNNLMATPAQSAYMASPNYGAGGAYNIITAVSRYKDIVIQGIQSRIIMLNSNIAYRTKV